MAGRITEARNKAGLTKAELARRVGVSGPTITDWESGKMKPRGENLMRLSSVLGASAKWLMTGVNNNTQPADLGRDSVPLISWVSAGSWDEAVDEFPAGYAEQYLLCPKPHGPHTYALRVNGDSMTAQFGRSYPDGTIIYVDPDKAGGVVSGDRIIARLDGEDSVTFKVYVEDSGTRFLKPLNPQYPLITEPFRILGKVIAALID